MHGKLGGGWRGSPSEDCKGHGGMPSQKAPSTTSASGESKTNAKSQRWVEKITMPGKQRLASVNMLLPHEQIFFRSGTVRLLFYTLRWVPAKYYSPFDAEDDEDTIDTRDNSKNDSKEAKKAGKAEEARKAKVTQMAKKKARSAATKRLDNYYRTWKTTEKVDSSELGTVEYVLTRSSRKLDGTRLDSAIFELQIGLDLLEVDGRARSLEKEGEQGVSPEDSQLAPGRQPSRLQFSGEDYERQRGLNGPHVARRDGWDV
ncbi:hypothetical protein LTR17_002972 [Elasticomyces elasticus]|nr:hypothetical protein LTR17_002972 [Elasticomyces elasticus]